MSPCVFSFVWHCCARNHAIMQSCLSPSACVCSITLCFCHCASLKPLMCIKKYMALKKYMEKRCVKQLPTKMFYIYVLFITLTITPYWPSLTAVILTMLARCTTQTTTFQTLDSTSQLLLCFCLLLFLPVVTQCRPMTKRCFTQPRSFVWNHFLERNKYWYEWKNKKKIKIFFQKWNLFAMLSSICHSIS